MTTVPVTSTTSAEPMGSREMRRYLTPVPLSRLLRVHLQIWRAQRGVVAGTILTLAIALAATVFGIAMKNGTFTAATAGQQFAASSNSCALLWLVTGAVAGAAPFRSHWAVMVLAVAPRRRRWFAACFASVLAWALGAMAAFGLAACAVTSATLAFKDQPVAAGVGVLTHLGPVAAGVALNVAVGFMLGAAARGVTVPLILGLVVAPAIPLLAMHWSGLGRWLDLGAATEAVTGAGAPHWGLPMITALCLWAVAPALIATWRLRRSPVG